MPDDTRDNDPETEENSTQSGDKPDPFDVLRTLDDEVIAQAIERDDKWGAEVRVCVALARGERPAREDCEVVGLPYTEPAAFKDILTGPGPASTAEPTCEQARPLAQQVIAQLSERTGE